MKKYELIIETKQPACGGKAPQVYDFKEIETDDPREYVQAQEPGLETELHTLPNGELVIEVNKDAHQVQYHFTEI